MGSWYETCGLSQLPIHSGDQIMVFILIENKLGKDDLEPSFSGTTGKFQPVGIPVSGTYNDYGGIEATCENAAAMFEMLTQGQNRMYRINVTENIDLNDIQNFEALYNDVIERGESTNMSAMMIRKDIFESLKAQASEKVAAYARDMKAFEETYRNLIQNGKATYGEDEHPYVIQQFVEMDLNEALDYDNKFADYLAGFRVKYSLRSFLRLAATESGIPEPVKQGVIDGVIADKWLKRLRKAWVPQSGKGSQDSDFEAHMALFDAVKGAKARYDKETENDLSHGSIFREEGIK